MLASSGKRKVQAKGAAFSRDPKSAGKEIRLGASNPWVPRVRAPLLWSPELMTKGWDWRISASPLVVTSDHGGLGNRRGI